MVIAIRAIGALPAEASDSSISAITHARGYLYILADRGRFPFLIDASRPFVWALENLIDEVMQSEDSRSQFIALQERLPRIVENGSRLAAVLDADLAHQPVYQVLPKRVYDMDMLISDATQMLSDDARGALEQREVYNLIEAGKCLAFEVPTAAGFHLFRAIDSVLQRYVRVITGSLPKNKNWGSYIKALEAAAIDQRITSVLFQLKEHHRNPIIHPDAQLSVDESLSLVGIAESALTMMLSDMKVRLEKS